MSENVTQTHISDEMVKEADRLENNPQLMLALIDLLFMDKDSGNDLPS